jgi:hypothetical protein
MIEEMKFTAIEALDSLGYKLPVSLIDDHLEWYGHEPAYTDAELTAEIARLNAKWDAQEYARQRKAEYPSIQDLVVALYDTEDRAAIDTKRAAVKAKYPK